MTESVEPLRDLLDGVHRQCATIEGGAPAGYIPELAAVDPRLFALAACAPDGALASAGDGDALFTLQSLSKPFVYGWALERLGEEAVHARVGVEPTGLAFDSVVRLEEASHLPHNPMVNAGAIAVTGLLLESGIGLSALLEFLGACAGRGSLTVDVPVWMSERAHGHRNRAIAHLLQHFGVLRAPVEATLDLYYRQCAALVSCRDLATLAGTLATHGRCPATGRVLLAPRAARQVLTVMSTCGLYDASGGFLFDFGVPAKSGVSGGLFAVAPGRLGLAAFSPPIDAQGTSLRARAAVGRVCERLDLHSFGPSRGATGPLAAPPSADLERALDQALSAAAGEEHAGAVADYAPQLARAHPDRVGIALCTVEGALFTRGDARTPFTLQAAANPFAYARVVEALGRALVHRHVGVEPSGNSFHAIVLDPRTNHPFNPLGNSGAITLAGLAPGRDDAQRLRGSLAFLSAAAGERLDLDAEMLEAEWAAGGRNRAIAALLRGQGLIENEEAALGLYLQQCCVVVDAVRLARMGTVLARGGRPLGSESPLLSPRTVRDTLSVMYTCGLHDGSGTFASKVGVPAKSGISGAIVAVVPGRMGIAVWSPAVDHQGTSVRGLAALRSLSADLGLGVFSPPPSHDAAGGQTPSGSR